MFWTRKRKTRRPTPSASHPPLALSLEPRLLFDGAVAATIADSATSELAEPQAATNADQDSTTDLAATPASGTGDQRQEVVFVDGNVRDYQQLVAGIQPGMEVVVLDGNQDGLQQIADYLEGRDGIDAVHVLGHGSLAQAHIGTALVNNDTLGNYADVLVRIGQSLDADGDILLYGCNISQGESGRAFIETIAHITQADIAASNDATGAAAQGGDWLLEFTAGTVEAEQAFDERLAGYQHLLSTTLSAGDIAVIGLNVDDPSSLADTQRWAFVAMTDLSSGTVIHFTDESYNADTGQFYGAIAPTEGHMTWTVGQNITAGTMFVVTNSSSSGNATIRDIGGSTYTGVTGSVGRFGVTGDQIFAYQGTAGTATEATFLYALNTAQSSNYANVGEWASAASTPNQIVSDRPVGLVDGTSAAVLTSSTTTSQTVNGGVYGFDNMKYAGITSGTREQLLTAIGDARNWVGHDDNLYDLSAIGNFTLTTPNANPTLTHLNNDIVTWAGVGNVVTLDTSTGASLGDAELGALNGGNGNWAGASLAVQRPGAAVSADMFGFDTSGAAFSVNGNALQASGLTFATFTSTGGVLTISFTSSGTAATTALVSEVAQRITYRNDTPAGDATLRFTLADGAGGNTTADVTVTSDYIYVTNATDTATIDASNGVSFSEAVAIAAADSTGSQTLVFDSSLAGTTLTVNSVVLNESLTLDMDAASGLTLTGGSLSLGAGTTQTLVDGAGDSVTISSALTGSGALTKAGAGSLTLSATNTYSGATTVAAGTLTLAGGDAVSGSSSVSVASGATLALSSNEAIGNLSGAGSIDLGANTLTSNLTADTTFSGNISGSGGLTVNQTGAATHALTLSGNNTYSGATSTLNYGWLKLDGEGAVSGNSQLRANGNGMITLLSDQTVGSLAGSNANASLQLGAFTLTAGGDDSSSTFAGAITGSGSLAKQGTGSLTLSGSNAYNGTTTVSAGSLSVAGDANLGFGTLQLAGGATLIVSGASDIDNAIVLTGDATVSNATDVTLSGLISGANLTKAGSGTLTLSGSNSYGATTVSGGTLSVDSDSRLGSGTVTLASGTTLALTGASVFDNAIVLGGSATVASSAAATLSGAISGAFNLTKAGAASLTLSGSNSYGATTVSAGTLSVAGDANLGSGTLTLDTGSTLAVTGAGVIDNSVLLAGSATLQTSANTTLSGSISGGGNLSKTGAATLTLSGSNGYTGFTSVNAGTLSIASDANLGAGSLNLANGTTLQITGSTIVDNALALNGSVTVDAGAAATLSGAISGTGGLTKTGASDLTLAASNTYTGATTVSAGTLVVDGSTNSATSVASGATLAGNGTLGGNLSVQSGGTLAPGSSGAGSLTVNGNLSLAAGSTLALDIAGTTAGTGYDQVVVNGTLDLSGATLAVTHGYAAGMGDSYTVIDNDGVDAVTGTFSGLSEGGTLTAAGNATPLTASYAGGTGNDLTLTAPIAPTVTSVSSDTANGTYKIGDTLSITVAFDSLVTVTGTPKLTLETGTTDRTLDYVSGSGTNTLTFSYTVQAGDSSADLDYASTSALSLNGGTIRDANDRDAILTLPVPGAAGSLGANMALVVDGVRPAATSITLSDTALRIGETATVTVIFNEPVSGLDIADFSVANGSLSGLSTSDDGLTWTATFTPSANISDVTNLITLDNTGVMDQAGNTGSGTTDSVNYAIDTQRPTASIVIADTALKAGQTTTVTLTFSEAVTGLTTADFSVANGSLSNLATSDNITWTATLTPGTDVTDASNLITLDNTGYTDLAGNTGTGTTDSNNYAIDTLRPTASIVVADTALKAGQTTTVTLTFSEAVTGLTTADLSVANGTLSNLATSDNITWTATLTPSTDVTDASNLITLDNTGVQDAAGNAGVGTTDSSNYAIDSQAPAVTSVDVPVDGTYVAGNDLDFTVNFDEAVTVDTTGGTPRLAITLDTGGIVYAHYVSGSGGTALVFRLTVSTGQQDANGIAVGASLDTNGGTLRDAAGNAALPDLASVGDTAGVQVDAAAPEVASITLDGSSPTADSTLGFTVTFDEAVSGVDLADFALVTSGSASGTLQSLVPVDARTYRVTVTGVTGQGSLGLSLAAAGSGIVDASGNPLGAGLSIPGYQVGGLDGGDPEFRANPTPPPPPSSASTPLQPSVPSTAPAAATALLPPPLIEPTTLGSGLRPVGDIFINRGALAPSFIAQVFGSSAGLGGGLGGGGLGGGFGGGLGGGTGGFGGGLSDSSSLGGIFDSTRQQPAEPGPRIGEPYPGNNLSMGPSFGAPSLARQLEDLQQRERQQVDALAWALGQVSGTSS